MYQVPASKMLPKIWIRVDELQIHCSIKHFYCPLPREDTGMIYPLSLPSKPGFVRDAGLMTMVHDHVFKLKCVKNQSMQALFILDVKV